MIDGVIENALRDINKLNKINLQHYIAYSDDRILENYDFQAVALKQNNYDKIKETDEAIKYYYKNRAQFKQYLN